MGPVEGQHVSTPGYPPILLPECHCLSLPFLFKESHSRVKAHSSPHRIHFIGGIYSTAPSSPCRHRVVSGTPGDHKGASPKLFHLGLCLTAPALLGHPQEPPSTWVPAIGSPRPTSSWEISPSQRQEPSQPPLQVRGLVPPHQRTSASWSR